MREKLKSWLQEDHIYYGLLLLGVGIASFLLGQASRPEPLAQSDKIGIEQPIPAPLVGEDIEKVINVAGVVASKSGTKYHLKSCPGAKTIKPENLIEFAGAAEAEAAGYKRAQNCP